MSHVYKRFNGKRVNHGSKDYDKGTWYVSKRIRGELLHRALPEARTKTEAEKIADKLISDRKARRYGLTREIVFKEFAEGEYTRYVEQHNQNVYVKEIFIRELAAFFGHMALNEITPQDCRDYRFKRLHTPTKHKSKRSPASVNKEMSTLSKLLNLACEQGYLQDSPMRHVKKLEEAQPRKRHLTGDQKKALWRELDSDPLMLRLVTLALNLPLRKSQYLAIRPADVDFENSLVWVIKSKGKPARPVPLNKTAAMTLRFMIGDGQLPFPIRYFYKRWHKILVDAGINEETGTRDTNFHFHDLRHVFGSQLMRDGVSPFVIQELFNHSDMQTSAIYITADDSLLHDAVGRLDPQEFEGIN
jgi:integrase